MGELNHGVATPLFWVRGALCAGLHVWIFHESHDLARCCARAHCPATLRVRAHRAPASLASAYE